MDELEFYQGQFTGQEIDDAINAVLNPDQSPDPDGEASLISSAGVASALDGLAGAVGIVVSGNQSAVAATVGQYVVLTHSTITGRDDGLYTAAKAIPANTTIDSTYLTAASGGGLNALNKIKKVVVDANATVSVTVTSAFRGLVVATGISTSSHGIWIFCTTSTGGSPYISELHGAAYLSVTTANNKITFQSLTNSSRIDVFIFELMGNIA